MGHQVQNSTTSVEFAISKPTFKRLSETIPAGLTLGIPYRWLLASYGHSFRVNASTSTVERLRKQLKLCENFDAFISHDWHTSRWLKYASLLLFLNARAAALATLVVSVACALLTHYQVIPEGVWPVAEVAAGYATFVIFLLWWQNIRDLILKPRLAFLDKLTIPQEDEELKEKCILGLAGFLAFSKKLAILWSDSYIDRVWCVYEFATFARIHGETRPVRAVPVALPLLFLVHVVWWLAIKLLASWLWWNVETADEGSQSLNPRRMLVFFGTLGMFFVTYPCQSIIGARMAKHLDGLAEKLLSFDVEKAKCSCCSKGHVACGQTIPCDREAIYHNILEWFGTTDRQTGISMFNEAVRFRYGQRMLQACGSQMIPLDLFICVVFSVNTPFFITRLPEALALAQQEASAWQSCAVAVRSLISTWAFIFPGMLMYMWSSKMVWSLNLEWPILAGLLSSCFVALITFGSTFVIFFSVDATAHDSFTPVASWSFFMFLGLLLLKPTCNSWSSTIGIAEVTGEATEDRSESETNVDSFSI